MGKYFDMLMEDVRMREGLHSCMNCGVCTGVCPAAEFYNYDPRQIVNIVQTQDDDAIEELMRSDVIWYCGECMSCRPRCPRGNTPAYVIQALRTLSQKLGFFVESEKGRQQLALKRIIGEFRGETPLVGKSPTFRAALEAAGVDLVFTPTPEIMYPQGLASQTFVEVPGISSLLEGALRPGHFRGVSTVVTKLFNLVQPNVACFGEKDYQQLALIRKMVADMAMPIEIVGVPTVRAEDGLALSSRNGYLTAAERAIAPELARTMNWIAGQIEAGNSHLPSLVAQASQRLDNAGFRTDAIDIVDADTLESASAESQRLVILMAAYLGKARLIDNRVVALRG